MRVGSQECPVPGRVGIKLPKATCAVNWTEKVPWEIVGVTFAVAFHLQPGTQLLHGEGAGTPGAVGTWRRPRNATLEHRAGSMVVSTLRKQKQHSDL